MPSFRSQNRVPLPGSERKPITEHPRALVAPAAAPVTAEPSEPVTVSVILKRKERIDPANFRPGRHLSHEELDERHGADPAAVEAVKEFAAEYGLRVHAATDLGRRTLHLTGTPQQMAEAFGVTLQQQTVDAKTFRVREGVITVPEGLLPYVEAVLGLDNRPQARPHCRAAKPLAANVSYTPVQVAQLYGFPADATADGQTIAVIELGGGYVDADIQTYFDSLSLPVPTVTAVLVDGGTNSPGDPNGADGEVMLDIEVAGAVAPGSNVAVYFAPNTDQGFLDAITTAIHDTTNTPSVISISWGGPESSWTGQAMTAMDDAFQAAAALGVSITAASGDNGASDGVADNALHVDFPASSPHVLACGGTKLTGTDGSISSEVVWNEQASNEGATGGGVSAFFAKPAWQNAVNVPPPNGGGGGRGVPDVAGDADPTTGYSVLVDGQQYVIGGTSAVAPLWAGLIALANATNPTAAGFLNPTLYGSPDGAFHDITQGDNGGFSAGPGWDACTGLGSPVGSAVISLLGQAGQGAGAAAPMPPAGMP